MTIETLNQTFSRLAAGKDKVSVEFGPGHRRAIDSAITIDHLPIPTADIVANVDDGLAFIPDGSVDLIYSSHFMEHVKDVGEVLAEFHRILKPGAELKIIVPHHSSPYYYSDYTHKVFWGLYTPFYFSDETFFRRTVPRFYNHLNFKVTDIRLVFGSPFRFRRMFKREFVERLVNLNRYMQELYEEQLCHFIPCYELNITMHKR